MPSSGCASSSITEQQQYKLLSISVGLELPFYSISIIKAKTLASFLKVLFPFFTFV